MDEKTMKYLRECFDRAFDNYVPKNPEQARKELAEIKRSAGIYLEKIERGQAIAHNKLRYQTYRGTA